MSSKEQAYTTIAKLVERFNEQLESYKKSDYNETQTRNDFINPFFKALGWDIDNSQGNAEAYREVIHEDKLKIGSATKAPDYSFRLPGGKRLFFVEAKKPSVLVKDDIVPAYQLRRYGWSAKLPISLITDFEEFAVYDCTKKPDPADKASKARIKYITYKQYLDEFDFIWNTFSKASVLKGSFDKYIVSDTNKKGTATVDKEFLASLDEWRILLAQNIALRNQTYNEDELNFVVQQTLDRIIFLRIAEDRSVEPYGELKNLITKTKEEGDYYQGLFKLFKEADSKYNSGLFDFKKDTLSATVSLDNKVVKTIINALYYPECPYEFSVLGVEILGSAYEQFLGKQIKLSAGHKIVIDEKPEVRKAGGVYYTPQYIVDYIVQNTVGKLTENKTPEQVAQLNIVDPACGSGSFLIGAYAYLLDWHLKYYMPEFIKLTEAAADATTVTKAREAAIKQRNKLPLTPDGHLTSALKKQILLNNIYGVDIDTQAVEVTKLSLLLKCMEGETGSSINAVMRFGERVLPTLDDNIKSGNSLIDLDFYDTEFDFGEEKKIKPFNWQQGFPKVFKKGGFDAVIGNPPYGAVYHESQKQYFTSHYKTVEGRYDNFEIFIEKGISLIAKNGLLSFIIPSPFLTNLYSRKLRGNIIKNYSLREVVSFSIPVFEDPTVHTCIIIIGCTHQERGMVKIKNQVNSIERLNSDNGFQIIQKDIEHLANYVIDVFINPSAKEIVDKLQSKSKSLGDICFIRQCIKTGDDEKFVMVSEISQNDPWKKSLRGKSIMRYGIIEKNVYLKYGDWLARNWKNKSFYETNKIAIRETGKRITATLDLDNRYFLSSLYAIYFKEERLNNENDLKFLLGILNSEVANYYIKLIALNLTEGAFTKVRTNQLARLPIIIPKSNKEKSLSNNIVALVAEALKLTQTKQQTTTPDKLEQLKTRIQYTDDKINKLVYDLYELSEAEIGIVEGK